MRLLVLTAVCAILTIPQVCRRTRAAAPPTQPEPQRVKLSLEKGPGAVKKARERGAATAGRDIKAGHPVILYCGRPWSHGKPLVDDATKLRVVVVGGCFVSEVFVAEVDSYNAAIRAWHARKQPKER
jgi:hypothetical protein